MKPALTPERWQRIEELFHRSLEQESGDRAGFLAAACDGNVELRRQVEALLTSYESSRNFIELPPLAGAISSIVEEAGDETAQITPPGASLIGHRIAHYEIESLLGTGGMSEVYLARDLKLDRQIAIKILPVQFTEDDAQVQRFEREARAASALNHPNIITIHEIGSDGKTYFIATEFVTGQTLREKIAFAEIGVKQTLSIAIQIAGALSAAHAAGIVHRDIKPENVMVRPDGLVKVLDFGLAKSAYANHSGAATMPEPVNMHTDHGMFMGTISYLSPEQVLRRKVDHRTDLFSFGVLLYEMLAGRRPFAGDGAAGVCAAILSDAPERVTKLRPEIPAALDRIIDKALAKETAARYQTADQLRQELQQLERELENTAGKAWSALGWKAALIGAVVVAAILLWLIRPLLGGAERASLWGDAHTTIKRLTSHGKVLRAALSPDGRYFAYVRADQGRRTLWLGKTSDGSSVLLERPSEVNPGTLIFSPDGNEIYCIGTTQGQQFSTLYRISTEGGVASKVLDHIDSQLAFSPDGQWIAFVRLIPGNRQNALVVARAADGKDERVVAVREWTTRFSFSGPSWSPDGKMLVIGAHSGEAKTADEVIAGVRLEDGAITLLSEEKWNGIYRLSCLPDGSGFVMIATDKAAFEFAQLWYVPYPRGSAHRITHDLDTYEQSNLSLSADGRTLLAVQLRQVNSVWVAPTAGLQQARQLTSGSPGSGTGLYGLDWTPEGRILYTVFDGEGTSTWSMASDGSDNRQITPPGYVEKGFSLSAVGQLVFQSNRDGELEVWRSDLNGGRPQRLTRGGGNSQPQVSPDGRWVIYTSRRAGVLEIWRVSIDGGQPTKLTDGETMWPRISPDGRLFACAYRAGLDKPWQLALYAVEGGAPLRLFDRPQSANFNMGFRWTLDGAAITYRDWEDGVWRQPLTGGPPQRLSGLPREKIYSYAWSPDGQQFAFTRGTESYDIALISSSK
ncbi:MAG TPA: LpqB family beta-propeller domain-containing protein [Blastocatellia bacterium]|nr:LpqB family beta-propeller domain-containing protein [Blastocatellia bacterium]